jgi:hypothetical protein
MNKNKERAILVISRRLKGEGDRDMSPNLEKAPSNAMDDTVDSTPGLMAAADEIIESVSTKDAGMLKQALRSFITMVMAEDEDEEYEKMES